MTLNPPQIYRKTQGIHRRGPAADKPAPGDVLVGTLYYSSDEFTLERSNGTEWESYSDAGLSASVYYFRTDLTSTTASDPGAGKYKYSNITQDLSTILFFDWLTDDGFDVHVLFQLFNVSTRFLIQDKALALKYQIWEMTAPAINMPDWFQVPVTFISGAGGNFTHNQRVAIILLPPAATLVI